MVGAPSDLLLPRLDLEVAALFDSNHLVHRAIGAVSLLADGATGFGGTALLVGDETPSQFVSAVV